MDSDAAAAALARDKAEVARLGEEVRRLRVCERETLEETGLAIRETKCIGVCNAVELDEQYHYVTPVCVGLTDEEPVNLEPNKCDGWAWVRWDDPAFPQPLFSGLRKIRASGFDPVASPAQTVVFVE